MSDIRLSKDGQKLWTAKSIPKNFVFGSYVGDLAELARRIDEREGEFTLEVIFHQ